MSESMLPIVLSLGAIYAFIPVIIIIVLLLAARGSIGGDFFEIFGITTIIGWTGGIGRGGVGKGLRSRYKTSTEKTKAAAGEISDVFLGKKDKASFFSEETESNMNPMLKRALKAAGLAESKGKGYGLKGSKKIAGKRYYGLFHGKAWELNEASKRNILAINMNGDPTQIRSMIREVGSDKVKKLEATAKDSELIDLAVYGLSLKAISNYYETHKKPAGTPPPLRPPGSKKGRIQEAVDLFVDFYPKYYGARRGGINSRSDAAGIIKRTEGWSTEQLAALLKSENVAFTPDLEKGQMVRLAATKINRRRVERFVEGTRICSRRR